MVEFLLGAALLGIYVPILPKLTALAGEHWRNILNLFISSWIFFVILHQENSNTLYWWLGASLLFTINYGIVSYILKK